MSSRVEVSAVMLLSMPLLFGAVVLSARPDEGLVKYRQSLMRAQAGHPGRHGADRQWWGSAAISAIRRRREPAHIDRLSGARAS